MIEITECLSDCYDQRPEGHSIDTIVLHTMCNPEEKDRFNPAQCLRCLESEGVSTHYLIDRLGNITRMINEAQRAWHSGVSKMPYDDDERENVNHFSIGIELIADEENAVLAVQYDSLARLVKDILTRHTITSIVGHADIAPGRKSDPLQFDWIGFRQLLIDTTPEAAGVRVSTLTEG